MRQHPNIVFILADDLGWRDLACEGSTFYESPHIDRIAASGMRFSQGYAACQVCSPSRASILTGKVPPRHGITDWIGAASGVAWRELGRHTRLLPSAYEQGLRRGELTFPQVLRDAGYRTLFVGKWHLGDVGRHPEQFGFEVNVGGWRVGRPMGGYFSPYANPYLSDGPPGESLPLRLATETASWIEAHRNEPFLAYLSFYSVHSPIQTTQERWTKYQRKAEHAAGGGTRPGSRFAMDGSSPVRQVQDCPIYAGMIETMDEAVGVVLDRLHQLGLNEDTIVCFTSDNGGASSGDSYQTSNLPLRGGKGRQWEGGIREPLHLCVPGLVAPGSTCNVPVSFIDLYPTLLELAGCAVPQAQHIDGLSLVPLLRDGAVGGDVARIQAISDRDLYWHYPHYGNQGGDPCAMIRRKNWKLIHYFEDGHDELYDLATDVGEQNDLNDVHPTRSSQMCSALGRWLRDTGARMPVPDPEYDRSSAAALIDEAERVLMPQLERQHAEYLEFSWEPNADWYQSQMVAD